MEDGIIFAISGGALTTIGGIIGAIIQSRRNTRRIENDPVNVKQVGDFVGCEDCVRCRASISKVHESIFNRINENQTRDASVISAINAQLGKIQGTLEAQKSQNDALLEVITSTFKMLADKIK